MVIIKICLTISMACLMKVQMIAGTLEFSSKDQSGFIEEDLISEVTGQRMRRSRWVERESFRMELGLYFIRGSSGELMYEDHFTEESALDGKGNDVAIESLDIVHEGMVRVS